PWIVTRAPGRALPGLRPTTVGAATRRTDAMVGAGVPDGLRTMTEVVPRPRSAPAGTIAVASSPDTVAGTSTPSMTITAPGSRPPPVTITATLPGSAAISGDTE